MYRVTSNSGIIKHQWTVFLLPVFSIVKAYIFNRERWMHGYSGLNNRFIFNSSISLDHMPKYLLFVCMYQSACACVCVCVCMCVGTHMHVCASGCQWSTMSVIPQVPCCLRHGLSCSGTGYLVKASWLVSYRYFLCLTISRTISPCHYAPFLFVYLNGLTIPL